MKVFNLMASIRAFLWSLRLLIHRSRSLRDRRWRTRLVLMEDQASFRAPKITEVYQRRGLCRSCTMEGFYAHCSTKRIPNYKFCRTWSCFSAISTSYFNTWPIMNSWYPIALQMFCNPFFLVFHTTPVKQTSTRLFPEHVLSVLLAIKWRFNNSTNQE